MSKTFTAPFAQTAKTSTAVVTVAAGSLNTDAPTGVSLLMTAGDDGAILTRLWAIPRGGAVANSLLLFIQSAGDTAIRLIDSEAMAAYTAATTTAIPETAFGNYSETTPIRLGGGDKLYVGMQTATATGVTFRAEWSNY